MKDEEYMWGKGTIQNIVELCCCVATLPFGSYNKRKIPIKINLIYLLYYII
jgi:hypothetical protein